MAYSRTLCSSTTFGSRCKGFCDTPNWWRFQFSCCWRWWLLCSRRQRWVGYSITWWGIPWPVAHTYCFIENDCGRRAYEIKSCKRSMKPNTSVKLFAIFFVAEKTFLCALLALKHSLMTINGDHSIRKAQERYNKYACNKDKGWLNGSMHVYFKQFTKTC